MRTATFMQVAPRTVQLEGGLSPDSSFTLPAFSFTVIATSPGTLISSSAAH